MGTIVVLMNAVYAGVALRPLEVTSVLVSAAAVAMWLAHHAGRKSRGLSPRLALGVGVAALALALAFLLPRMLLGYLGIASANAGLRSLLGLTVALCVMVTFVCLVILFFAVGASARSDGQVESASALMLAIRGATWGGAFVAGISCVGFVILYAYGLPAPVIAVIVGAIPVFAAASAGYVELVLVTRVGGIEDSPRLRQVMTCVTSATGVEFDRVLVVGGVVGAIDYSAVYWLPPRDYALLITKAVIGRLTESELKAMVAHEAEHARGHHAARRAALEAGVGCAIALSVIGLPDLRGSESGGTVESFVRFAAPFMIIGAARHAVLQRLARRFEDAADRLAVDVAGEMALLAGLEKFGNGAGWRGHRPFSTHSTGRSTFGARIGRIHAYAAARGGSGVKSTT